MTATSDVSPVETIMNLALGYLLSRSLYVATELGIADLLKDGPQSLEHLAAATNAQPQSLYRLLRTLAAQGVFVENESGHFCSTPAAALLQQGVMRDGVLFCGEVAGDGSWWNAVGKLRHSVMTGEPAFNHQHGMDFFAYLAHHPQCSEWFDRGMANFATAENAAIVEAYDFSRFSHIIDVGGGQGGLLAEIIKRSANAHGTLFDQPHVVHNPMYLRNTGIDDRWTTFGGNFFEAVPKDGDVYILKRILHDWSDEQCLRILRCCREALDAHARLLVIDAVVPSGNTPHPSKVMDILMMVFGEGRERTAEEFSRLFAQVGLQMTGVTITPSTLAIVEAIPA